jgi:hypothetical protein
MTEAIKKAVALIDFLKDGKKVSLSYQHQHGSKYVLVGDSLMTVIAALEAMQGVADGTHVVVPYDPSAEMLEAGEKAWKAPRMHVSFSLADDFNTCGVIYRAMINKAQE